MKRPHLFDDLQRAEKFVILSFSWTLMAVLVKKQYDEFLVNKICEVIMLVSNGLAMGYLFYKIFFVYLQKVSAVIEKLKAWYANRKEKKNTNVLGEMRRASSKNISMEMRRSSTKR